MSASLEMQVDTSGIDNLLAKFPQNKRQFVNALGEVVVGNMVESFNTSPPGKQYVITDNQGRRRTHTASQPGYPPNTMNSDLINSLRYELRGSDTVEIRGAEHGLYLEDSTELNRPFIQPAVSRASREQVVGLGKRWLFEG